jgi:hypothetical protein
MSLYQIGEDIRVDIPDPSDPDHHYHAEVGTIVEVVEDDLGSLTGTPQDSYLYTIDFDDPSLGTMDFCHSDLKPA